MAGLPELRFEETLLSLKSNTKRYRLLIGAVAGTLITTVALWAVLSTVPVYVAVQGVVAPESDAQPLISQIDGVIVRSIIKNGRQVKKGDLIAQLDASTLELRLEATASRVASLKKAEATYRARKAQIRKDLQSVSLSELADKTAIRRDLHQKQLAANDSEANLGFMEDLHASGRASQHELDQARLRAESDRLMVSAWRERLTGASLPTEARRIVQRETLSLNERLIDIQAELSELAVRRRTLERELQHYRIYAPLDGTIVRGDMLAAGVRVSKRQELAMLEPNASLIVRGTVPAEKGGRVNVGQNAKLELSSFSRARFGFVDCVVSKVVRSAEDADLEIQLRMTDSRPGYFPSAGHRGTVHVEVEQASPLELLLDQI